MSDLVGTQIVGFLMHRLMYESHTFVRLVEYRRGIERKNYEWTKFEVIITGLKSFLINIVTVFLFLF